MLAPLPAIKVCNAHIQIIMKENVSFHLARLDFSGLGMKTQQMYSCVCLTKIYEVLTLCKTRCSGVL